MRPMTDQETASTLFDECARQRERIAKLEAALRTTQRIVVDAAMTGFNCHDGDWAERLFANQSTIAAVLSWKP